MPSFPNHTLTDAGRTLIADAHTGKKLTFTKLKVGSGTPSVAAETMTDLVQSVMNAEITQISRDPGNENWVRIRAVLNNVNLITGFIFSEIGVFAETEGSLPETMYSYAHSTQGDIIPPYDGSNPVIIYPTVIVIVDRTIDIQANILIGADFNCENIGPTSAGAGVYARREGYTFLFKRIAAGTNIEITEDASRIIIGQRVLRQDVDLYVSPTANNVSPNFTTLKNAHDYLLSFTIPGNRTATINMSGDTWVANPSFFIFEHPNSQQIRIVGAPRQARQLNSMSAAKVATVAAAGPALTVNRIVFIANEPGLDSNAGNFYGACRVTAVAGNNITLTQEHAGQPISYAQAGITGAQLAWFPTILENMYIRFPYGIGLLKNLTFYRGSSVYQDRAVEIWAKGTNEVRNLVFYYCGTGLFCNAGEVYGHGFMPDGVTYEYSEMIFGSNDVGILITVGGSYDHGLGSGLSIFNGNALGISMVRSDCLIGSASPTQLWHGFYSNGDGLSAYIARVIFNQAWFGQTSLTGWDVRALMGSIVDLQTSHGIWIEAQTGSFVNAVNGTWTSGSPAFNTWGNHGAYIAR